MNGFVVIQYSGQLNEDLIFVTLSNTAAQIFHLFPEDIVEKSYRSVKGKHKQLDDFVIQLHTHHSFGKFIFKPHESDIHYEIAISEVEANSKLILFNKIEDRNQFTDDRFSLNLFNNIFSKTIDACFLLENNGVFIGCNPSAVNIFEATTADKIVGRTPSELSPEFQECGTFSSVKAQEMMYIAKHKGSHLFEWTHLKMNKSPLLCEVSLTFLEINHNEYFLTIIRDISQKKAKEKALSESEKLYRMLAENTDDIIWLMNPQIELTYVSPSIEHFSGYSSNEILSLSFEKLFTIDSYKQFSAALQNEIRKTHKVKSHISFTLQLEHLHKDGRVIWGEMIINFVKDSNNNVIEILGVTRDISEQKTLESILQFEKERYRAIIEAYDGFIYICSPDNVIEFMNEKLINRTGYDGTGKPCYEVLHGLKDVCEWCVSDQVQKGRSVQWEVKSPKDNRWYSSSNTPIFRSDGQISKQAMIQDITDSKQAEISLRESEAKFRVLSDSSPMAVFIYQGHKFKYVNPAMEELTKYSKEELLTMNFYDFVHPDFYDIAKTRGLKRQKGINLPDRYELKITSKTGNELWVDFSGTFIDFDGAGAALGTAYNITERKNAEEALRQSEEKYRMLIQNQSDLIIKISTEGCFEYVSPSYCTVFGKTEDELIGNSFYPHIHEDDIGHTLDEMQKLKKPPYTCNIEHRSLTITGWRWFAWSNKAIFDKKRRFQSIIGVGRDISERKDAELALIESEDRFRSLIELAVDGIVMGDEQGLITDVNKRFLEIINRKRKDIIGKHIKSLFSAEILQEKPLQFELIHQGHTIVSEREIKRPDGQIVTVEMHSKKMPNNTYQSFIRDITLRKANENKQNDQKRFLETLIGNLPGIVYRCRNDRKWTMEFISGRFRELTGYPSSEFINNKKRTYESIIHPEHRGKIWEKWQQALKQKKVFADEYLIITADGSERWVFEQGAGVFDEKGNVYALEGFIMDITDRRIAEDAVIKSQFNFKMLVGYNQLLSKSSLVFAMAETIEELEFMIDKYFQQLTGAAMSMLMHFNRKSEQLALKHYIVSEDISSKIFRLFGEEAFNTNIQINEHIEKDMVQKGVIRSNNIEDVSFGSFDPHLLHQLENETNICEVIVSTIQRQNNLIGTLTAFMQNTSAVPDEILKTYSQLAGFALSRKRSELDLIEAKNKAEMSDKMKSVFLANISHEIKSPMNAIMGFAELLEKPNLQSDERLKYTEIITKAGNQLLGIIDDLIDLAKIESGQMRIIYNTFDVIQLLRNLHEMLQPKFISKGLDFRIDISGDHKVLLIESDNLRVKQILINLLDNAFKYTNYGEVTFGYSVFGNIIRFYVKDTGIGISSEDSERIFERFVKLDDEHSSQNSGKGLGLSISKSLAEMLGGQIHLESAIHRGTVFYLTLPLKKKR